MEFQPVGTAIPHRKTNTVSPKARVLLTNAYGPFPLKWGKSVNDMLGARLARDNNMDGRARLFSYALYLIAENLRTPCTVLDFPRWNDFEAEVRKGYDVVAIQLVSMHMARVAKMIKAIRELSPRTEIVVGGYGVGNLHQPVPGDKQGYATYIRTNADHICRGEGVRFMRELLGDEPVDRPITQYNLPTAEFQLSRFDGIQIDFPVILVSLGCPGGCEFCNTSAFFFHQKQRVAGAVEIYETMKAYQKRLKKDALTFILFDEDIFLDRDFVLELGRLIRSDRNTWGFRWASFGSMSALSAFSPRELRECGVEAIWIGVESGLEGADRKSRTGYAKREAAIAPQEFFPELRRYGIHIIGSMILGFDFHTPDNIEEDIDYFVNLKPTLYQVGTMRPCPGTKLYDKLLDQGRINDIYDWEDIHLWEVGSFKLQNLQDKELRRYYDLIHEKLKTINGPPILQIFEAYLLAYQTLKDANTEYLRYQAERSGQIANRLFFVVKAIESETPWPLVRERARELLSQAQTVLAPEGFGALRGVYHAMASRLASSAHLVGTYGWKIPPVETGEDAPASRWAYYHQEGSSAPIVIDHAVARTRGAVKAFWRVINRPAKPPVSDTRPDGAVGDLDGKQLLGNQVQSRTP
jgi:hypothetical protein